jgi:glycosyltransferase involved in cell wall biosynthesis
VIAPFVAISLIVPTYNRCELLRASVPALLHQRTDGLFEYEVIFVSNGSTDSTAQFLGALAELNTDRLRFFEIQATGGPSGPRNRGLCEARGEVAVILDDDVVPHEDFALQHWLFHQKHPEQYHAALGEVYVPDELLHDPMSLFHSFPYGEVRSLHQLNFVHFWTCNVSIKRKFMLDHGMFDEYMLYFEDILVGYRLSRAGMRLQFLPEARGQHLHKLQPAQVAQKGKFTGRWLFDFVERLPVLEVKRRFGIFDPEVPVLWLLRKAINRVMFRLLDNSLTHAVLRATGSERGGRSRCSDFHYYLIFRRNMLAGYYERRAERRAVNAEEVEQYRSILESK